MISQIGVGDIQIHSGNGYDVMMYYDEEKGIEYIDHVYMDDTDDITTLENLTSGTPLLVTLSDSDYDTFEKWMNNLNEGLIKESGEWDDSDDEMSTWKEDMKNQATYLASKIEGGKLKSVKGFDKYQGPFAVVETPKHGDVIVWTDPEDDTGFSFNVEVPGIGWISGDMNHLYRVLNQDEIPETEIIKEGKENKLKEELTKEKEMEIMKKTGLWDGRDETYKLAKKHFEEIKKLAREFK